MDDYGGRRDVGNALINIGSQLGQIYVNKLEASEKSGARARWYGQESKIDGLVSDNINSPEMILSEFEQMQEKAHKDVVGSTRTPGARQQIEAEFEINWANAKKYIENKTKQLISAKSIADYKVNMATLTEAPPEGSTVSKDWVAKQMEGVVEETNDQFKLGILTDDEQEYAEKQAAIKIFGHWALQQALDADDPEAFFKNINKTIQEDKDFKKNNLGIENLFSTEDVDKLRAEYNFITRKSEEKLKAFQKDNEKAFDLRLADPEQKNLPSVGEIDAAYENDEIDQTAWKGFRKLMDEGPKGKDDDEAVMAVNKIMGQVRKGVLSPEDALEQMKPYKTEMKPTTWNGKVDALQGLDGKSETAKTYFTMLEGMLAGHETDYPGNPLGATRPERALAYNIANKKLTEFEENNPNATAQQWEEEWKKAVAEPVTKKWFLKAIGNFFTPIPVHVAKTIMEERRKTAKAGKSKYKSGDTRTVNGTTYTFDGQFWKD